MPSNIVWLAIVLLLSWGADAMAQQCPPSVVKVPCRDMGDGRTLVDSAYLPDGFVVGKNQYRIIHTRPASMGGEWANLVCTLRLS